MKRGAAKCCWLALPLVIVSSLMIWQTLESLPWAAFEADVAFSHLLLATFDLLCTGMTLANTILSPSYSKWIAINSEFHCLLSILTVLDTVVSLVAPGTLAVDQQKTLFTLIGTLYFCLLLQSSAQWQMHLAELQDFLIPLPFHHISSR